MFAALLLAALNVEDVADSGALMLAPLILPLLAELPKQFGIAHDVPP